MEVDPAQAPAEPGARPVPVVRDRLEAGGLLAAGNVFGVVALSVLGLHEGIAFTLLLTGCVLQGWGLARLCLFGGVRPGFLGCAVLGVPLALWLSWTQIVVWLVSGRL